METTRMNERAASAVALPRSAETLACRSSRRLTSLDRLPPRSPGYGDAQVPDRPSPLTRHGAIAHYWFYIEGSDDNVAFGLRDIEVSVTPITPEEALVELYCIGDGFQSGHGRCLDRAIPIELRSGDAVLARLQWRFPDILSGHADPITASWRVAMNHSQVAALDSLILAQADAFVLVASSPTIS
jgi:hypothetical protein